MPQFAPQLAYLPAGTIQESLKKDPHLVLELIRKTYCDFAEGRVVNPFSSFLRMDTGRPNRIIALPAAVGEGPARALGIKWISSFPENIDRQIPRASGALVLNDPSTGFPIAIMEATQISGTRTAASALLFAHLTNAKYADGSISFVGAGKISGHILDMLLDLGGKPSSIKIYDSKREQAQRFLDAFQGRGRSISIVGTLEEAFSGVGTVFIATSASKPYLEDPNLLSPGQSILHISLRDFQPELLEGVTNIVDDAEHCLREGTSLHLLKEKLGNGDFVAGDIYDLISGRIKPDAGRPVVFSPFGLGCLDMALAAHVLDLAKKEKKSIDLEGFFPPY